MHRDDNLEATIVSKFSVMASVLDERARRSSTACRSSSSSQHASSTYASCSCGGRSNAEREICSTRRRRSGLTGVSPPVFYTGERRDAPAPHPTQDVRPRTLCRLLQPFPRVAASAAGSRNGIILSKLRADLLDRVRPLALARRVEPVPAGPVLLEPLLRTELL